MKKPPYLYLCGRYLMAQRFPLPGHVSDILQILRNGKLCYGILMCKDKLGYSACVLLVSLCLPQRELSKVCNEKRVYDDSLNTLCRKKGIQINVITCCGFHRCHNIFMPSLLASIAFRSSANPVLSISKDSSKRLYATFINPIGR